MNQYSLEVCVADAKRGKISIGLSLILIGWESRVRFFSQSQLFNL